LPDINDLIKEKLTHYSTEIQELALEAIKLSESGLPEISVSEQLGNVVRQILRKKDS